MCLMFLRLIPYRTSLVGYSWDFERQSFQALVHAVDVLDALENIDLDWQYLPSYIVWLSAWRKAVALQLKLCWLQLGRSAEDLY